MLVPEIWCRMRVYERDPEFLIKNGYLEKVEDFEYQGRTVLASRLGYRITGAFAERFLGRIFEMPGAVFPEELLRPEKQGLDVFVSGVEAICEAQRGVAQLYIEDGSIEAACPPIKALLHIMAFGHYEGKTVTDPAIRGLFTREVVLATSWYRQRLLAKQRQAIALWKRHVTATGSDATRSRLAEVESSAYLDSLIGTIGADPFTAL